jgi:hypothetical protein
VIDVLDTAASVDTSAPAALTAAGGVVHEVIAEDLETEGRISRAAGRIPTGDDGIIAPMSDQADLDSPDTAAAYELAYREGVRALSEQQIVTDSFRTRAGLLLSGAAIATSFLGQAALDRGTTAFTWFAIAAFVALGGAVLGILWPRRDWEYAMRPELLIENYIEHPQPFACHRSTATSRCTWTGVTCRTAASSCGLLGCSAWLPSSWWWR